MHDIYLRWETAGWSARASTNRDLTSIVNTDARKLIGEFAIGTNPHVKHFSKDILLDEKIGGTIHIALGRALIRRPAGQISPHPLDIVKDMRTQGEIYLDGKLIFQNGKVLL
jgi:aminopeptidase